MQLFISMIKLTDVLKEAQQIKELEAKLGRKLTEAELQELDWKKLGRQARNVAAATAIGAASILPNKAVGQQKATTPTTQQATQAKQGTDVDGIYGQYTSQFRFPGAAEVDKLTNVKTDLGLEGNTALKQLKSFGTERMKMWNKLTDFAETHTINGKKIFGNPDLDKDSDLGLQVIAAFNETPEGKNSWIKDTNDIKLAQKAMKSYRIARIEDWKAGAEDIKKGLENTHSTITMSGDTMDPTKVADVKRVENNFMLWAKDIK